MSNTSPDYDEINDALVRIHAEVDAAESHGRLCGMLASHLETGMDEWLASVLPPAEAGDALVKQSRQVLEQLFKQTRDTLRDRLFDFVPMLPDDEAIMVARLEALANWCQGFLFGMALGGVTETRSLPGDLPEIIEDMVQISRAQDYDTDEDEEQDESAYMELVEYVRVGVQMFVTEMRQLHAPQSENDPTMH